MLKTLWTKLLLATVVNGCERGLLRAIEVIPGLEQGGRDPRGCGTDVETPGDVLSCKEDNCPK